MQFFKEVFLKSITNFDGILIPILLKKTFRNLYKETIQTRKIPELFPSLGISDEEFFGNGENSCEDFVL